ncbi:hypothetical protein HK102_012376, partial [Quaeritorhiza haematococci]
TKIRIGTTDMFFLLPEMEPLEDMPPKLRRFAYNRLPPTHTEDGPIEPLSPNEQYVNNNHSAPGTPANNN